MRAVTAVIEYDPATKLYVGTVPGLPGAHTQAQDLDELHANLEEVVALCLEELRDDAASPPTVVGLQVVEVPV